MLYNGKPTAARLAQLAALKKDSAYRRHGRLEWGDERFVCCKKFGARSEEQLALDSEEEESEATPLRVLQFLVNQTIQDKKDPVAYFNKVVQYVNNTDMDTLEVVNAPALPTVEGLPGGEGDLEDAEDFTI
eukprot:jgi/Chlat1/7374/Chrsp6S09186